MKQLPFHNEHFRQALRTTLTIVGPVALFFYLGQADRAVAIGLGALSVALSDLPGDRRQKAWSLPLSCVVLAAVALLTGLLLPFAAVFGVLLAVFCFSFSMLSVYGGPINAISNLALIMMVFTFGLKPANSWSFASEIFAGGLWYSLSAWLYAYVFPYRHIEQELRECVAEIAAFLESKACFYDPSVPLEACYKRVIPGHLLVSEKQDRVRATLLRESVILHGDRQKARRLLHQATEVIDLYEEVLSIHHDYEFIRQTLQQRGILSTVHQLIKLLAEELRTPTMAITLRTDFLIKQLKNVDFPKMPAERQLVERLITNFENIRVKIKSVHDTGNMPKTISITTHDALRFAGDEPLSAKNLLQQIDYHSPVFRFALRLSLCCIVAYTAMQLWLPGKYNYWLLLTIVIVARPAFSTTRRRNFQRLTGSLVGVALAFLSLQLVHATVLQLLLVIGCLFGYLAFLYINYQLSVVFITMVAIIGLGLLGGQGHELLWQRAFDSLLGCAVAVIACFIFPFWESRKIKHQLLDYLSANIKYLEQLQSFAQNGTLDRIEYKLARKQIFTSAANLSRTYQHTLIEPGSNNINHGLLYQFQISNHQLYGAAASLFLNSAVASGKREVCVEHICEAIACLHDSLETLNAEVDAHSITLSAKYGIDLQPIAHTPSGQFVLLAHVARQILSQSKGLALAKF